ncbi:MAG: PBP1A family penicillin-binding protein [Fibromonadaceae bacterium]|jgi:penicillin-binding protein 1A|nr:PBP1A family penicillin-binding protein [Fibromonadaceae bacterium]
MLNQSENERESKREERNLGKKKLLWILILGFPVILGTVAVKIVWDKLIPTLPSFEKLETIEPRLITKIYDKDSLLAHEFYVEKRIWTSIDSIPDIVKNAVIATEDRKFWDHWGMNPLAIPSAVVESFRTGNRMRGASSLTQQLAKLLFLTPERSMTRKIREAMTAIRIEKTYTKKEILEFYLNEVYLAGGNYGFQSAGQFYFGRPLDSLTIPEIAVLTGMLQRPEAYRPDRKPEAALARRNTVLYAMMDAGYISRADYDGYVKTPLNVEERADVEVAPYYMEEIRKYLENKYGENSLYSDGISVYSTIDPEIQKIVENAAFEQRIKVDRRLRLRTISRLGIPKKYDMTSDSILVHFDSIYADFTKNYLEKDTAKRIYPDSLRYRQGQIAVILIENETGAIRAMVGGKNFNESKWNRAVQTLRQPGSSFKPFVYAVAMDNGASPCDSVNDAPITIPDPMDTAKYWRPGNYSKEFKGMMTYRRALALSQNLPAIQVGMKYGLNSVVNYARKFGVKKAPLQAVPSLALGSVGATLMEMTSAYTVFPNGGTRIEPYYIEAIVGKNGEVIETNYKVEHEVLKKPAAYIMVSMLQSVNTGGTAAKVWGSGFHHPSGGKTGTTNDYTDAWYIGFTKQYTMGIWVGTDDFVPMGPGHTGSDDALPVWINSMTEIHKDLPKLPFPVPAGVVGKNICNYTGKVKGAYCNAITSCLYTAGYSVEEVCNGVHFEQPKESGTTLFNSSPGKQDNNVRQMF